MHVLKSNAAPPPLTGKMPCSDASRGRPMRAAGVHIPHEYGVDGLTNGMQDR